MHEQGKHEGSGKKHFEVRELVSKGVIGCAVGFPVAHEVDDEGGGADEEDFHERVVQGNEVHEQVQVTDAEHHQVDFLRLARKT